jgi:hypothetical protein
MYGDGACQRCVYNLLHSAPVVAVACMSGTRVHQRGQLLRAPLPDWIGTDRCENQAVGRTWALKI